MLISWKQRALTVTMSVATAALAPACGVDDGSEDTAKSGDAINATSKPAPPPSTVVNPCGPLEVNFAGKCRAPDFFGRFLTSGAVLIGVAGPQSKNVDSGVVVVEGFDNGTVESLYILPEKLAPGQPMLTTRLYRADYPVVAVQTFQTWKDTAGFANTLVTNQGAVATASGLRFGVKRWTRRTETASGYRETYSDGTAMIAIASSSGGADYCTTAAAGAAGLASAACMGYALLGSAAVGVAAGLTVLVGVTGATAGTGAPAGGAEGLTVGAAVLAAGATAGAVLCSSLGHVIETGLDAQCNAPAPPGVDDIHFIPFLPVITVNPDAGCPAGMILYTGEVVTCGGTTATYSVGEDGIETVEVSANCTTKWVDHECAVP